MEQNQTHHSWTTSITAKYSVLPIRNVSVFICRSIMLMTYSAGSDLNWTFAFTTTQTPLNKPDLIVCRAHSGPDYQFGFTAPVVSAFLAGAGRPSRTEPNRRGELEQLQPSSGSRREPNLPAGPLFRVIPSTLGALCADPFMMLEKFHFLFPNS